MCGILSHALYRDKSSILRTGHGFPYFSVYLYIIYYTLSSCCDRIDCDALQFIFEK